MESVRLSQPTRRKKWDIEQRDFHSQASRQPTPLLRKHLNFGLTGSNVTPKTIFQVCGLSGEMAVDEAAGGTAFMKGV